MRRKISANGLFPIDKTILVSILSTSICYLIILVQFQMTFDSKKSTIYTYKEFSFFNDSRLPFYQLSCLLFYYLLRLPLCQLFSMSSYILSYIQCHHQPVCRIKDQTTTLLIVYHTHIQINSLLPNQKWELLKEIYNLSFIDVQIMQKQYKSFLDNQTLTNS